MELVLVSSLESSFNHWLTLCRENGGLQGIFQNVIYLHIHLRYIFESTCKFYFSFFLFLSIVVNKLGTLMFGVLYYHQYSFDMVIYGDFSLRYLVLLWLRVLQLSLHLLVFPTKMSKVQFTPPSTTTNFSYFNPLLSRVY